MTADLVRYLGMGLDRARASIGWGDLWTFVQHLGPDSATWRALNPTLAPLESNSATWSMLANVVDAVTMAAWNIGGALTHRRTARPKPFPRPWDSDEQSIGKDPIAIADFDEWYYEK